MVINKDLLYTKRQLENREHSHGILKGARGYIVLFIQ